jgi:acetyl-CoA synthetase
MNQLKHICKGVSVSHRRPKLADLDAARATFSWGAARQQLAEQPDGGLNIAWQATERHSRGPRAGHTAIRWLGRDGARREISYLELTGDVHRFANVLRGLGIGKGDSVFLLCGRIPELYIAALGALRIGAVVAPLFSAFGPEPIKTRLAAGRARALVTTGSLYRRKVAPIAGSIPSLEHVLIVGGDVPQGVGLLDASRLMAAADAGAPPEVTTDEDHALLHFTSGTTGQPKGALHVHGAVVSHYVSAQYALDLDADDIYWCTADPGWVTGTSYGIIAPLVIGATSVVDEGDFDADRWYRILDEERVSVWYTAPTAIRMLMKAGPNLVRAHAREALRFIASVGEPLNPQAVWWAVEHLGLPIHDNWWQTETGAIMIANTAAFDIKPGSMGRPLPGVEACIVERNSAGQVCVVDTPGVEGELALKVGWPSMFRGYRDMQERYHKCFAGDLYLSGDLVRRDADGYFWFVGRADDVIKSAGHLIGPFEVESVLMEHPALAEAGVIGVPDPTVGESVKAFVSLKSGCEGNEALRLELLGHARRRLGAAVAPKAIAFLPVLPRTRSGKIMRRLLKARELGLPEGDTSTLEGGG